MNEHNDKDDVKRLNKFSMNVIEDIDFLIKVLPKLNEISIQQPDLLRLDEDMHKQFRSAWEEARRVVAEIRVRAEHLPGLKEHGLTGEQLNLKLSLYYAAKEKAEASSRSGTLLDRWMKRLLGFINPTLKSLAQVIPGFNLVTEIKELAENCF